MKRALMLVLVLLVLTSGCGYRLSGRGKSLPVQFSSVCIPAFQNETLRYGLERILTDAVRAEFVSHSRLHLVDLPEKADAVLEGKVLHFIAKPVSYTKDGAANVYEVNIGASIRLLDRKAAKIIYENERITFRDTYETESGDFFSQETDALQRVAERFAASVVSSILENF